MLRRLLAKTRPPHVVARSISIAKNILRARFSTNNTPNFRTQTKAIGNPYSQHQYHNYQRTHQYNNYQHRSPYTPYISSALQHHSPPSQPLDEKNQHVKAVAEEPKKTTEERTYPEVKDTPKEKIFTQDQSDNSRLSWLGTTFVSLYIMPLGILNSLDYFVRTIAMRLRDGSGNFFDILIDTTATSIEMALKAIGAGIIFPIISGASIIYPRIGQAAISTALLENIYNPFKAKAQHSLAEYNNAQKLFVETDKGIIDSVDLLTDDPRNEKYLIRFCGMATTYLNSLPHADEERRELDINIRLFNYPKQLISGYTAKSKMDFINAGKAQIYQLAKDKQWTNKQIAANVFIMGHSLGGGIALEVAKYFKIEFGIDIPILVFNSFNSLHSAIAGHFHQHCGLSINFGRRLTLSVLESSGNWDLNSIDAAQKLNPDYLYYINLIHPTNTNRNADNLIPDGSTFTEGMATQSSENMNSDGMLHKLRDKYSEHLALPPDDQNHHSAKLSTLKIKRSLITTSALNLLRHSVVEHNHRNRAPLKEVRFNGQRLSMLFKQRPLCSTPLLRSPSLTDPKPTYP